MAKGQENHTKFVGFRATFRENLFPSSGRESTIYFQFFLMEVSKLKPEEGQQIFPKRCLKSNKFCAILLTFRHQPT
jgi:hypothetical protein